MLKTTLEIMSRRTRSYPALGAHPDEDHSDVRSAIVALAPDYREPLVLQVLMGYSIDEIATHLE